MTSTEHPERVSGRRGFMIAGAGALLALAIGPARARAAASTARRIRMLHAHTGERIDVTYFEQGSYLADAMADVDRFLRDFRTGEVHPIDPAVLDVAWSVAGAAERPLGTYEIIGGYRSPRTNDMLRETSRGVARHSLHMDGRALDLRLSGVATEHVRDLALALRRGGVGFYRASDFVHVDTGRVRHW